MDANTVTVDVVPDLQPPTPPVPTKDGYVEDTNAKFDVKKAKFEYVKEMAGISIDNARWKNRRRMAWICLWAMIVYVVLIMFLVPSSKVTAMAEVSAWFMMATASIIGTYIGTSTWAYISGRKQGMGNGMYNGNQGGYSAYDEFEPQQHVTGNRVSSTTTYDMRKSDYYSEK
jgi:hypothetical protein